MPKLLPIRLLLAQRLMVGLCLAVLPGCTFYQSLLGYSTLPRPQEFTLYNPHFTADHADVFSNQNMPFGRFYYRAVPGSGLGLQAYSYLKFREDGSFFTAFMPIPPEQFH